MDVQEDLDVNNVFDNEKKEVSNSMNKWKTIRVILIVFLIRLKEIDDGKE